MLIHEYTTPCTKALYEEYGQIETSLLLQGIQSLGIHFEEGFRTDDGKIYHHMLLVMTDHALDNLHELFPGVTTQWSHKERQHERNHAMRRDAYITSMKNGKLYIDTKDVTIRA